MNHTDIVQDPKVSKRSKKKIKPWCPEKKQKDKEKVSKKQKKELPYEDIYDDFYGLHIPGYHYF